MQKILMTVAAAVLVAGCASGTGGRDGGSDARAGVAERRAPSVDLEVPEDEEIVEVLQVQEPPVRPVSPERAAAQLEMLKGLAGTWVSSGAEGAVPGASIRYAVTSAGSAVVETIFPGEEHEMVSVYHLDNGRLVMTHYCAMGNQPRFTSEAGTADDVIRFRCTGAGNTQSHAEPHMHEGVFTVGKGTLHTEWTMYQDLQRGGTVVLDLVRGDG